MRIITIDVPFGLTIKLRTKVPGRLSIGCKARNPGSNGSDGTSSIGVSQLRTDEILVDVPPDSPRDNLSNLERTNSRTSQRTEPAYNDDWDLSEWLPYFQEHGIKIRDFATEPFPVQEKVPEVFDPCIALLKYERMVKMRAREVMQLYDIRWLTEEQARLRLPPEEWVALGDLDRRSREYPWTHLKVEKPIGTHDEVVSALRLHIKRTYAGRKYLLGEHDVSDIEFDGHSVTMDHPHSVLSTDIHGRHTDISLTPCDENGDREQDETMPMINGHWDANGLTHVSGGVTKRLHVGDHLSPIERRPSLLRPQPKQQKFSIGGHISSPAQAPLCPEHPVEAHGAIPADTIDSFSSNMYPTPSHSPSPSPTTHLPRPSVIGSAATGDPTDIMPSQTRSNRGLARTQTLRSF